MKNVQDLEGDDLLDALGVEAEKSDAGGYTPKQERIIAGFEDILRFRETHGHAPQHGEGLDIFERLYAVRLDQLRKLPDDDLSLLRPMDRFDLLAKTVGHTVSTGELSDDELLAALETDVPGDIGKLVHVQHVEDRRELADYDRVKCEDFDLYRPLFEAAEADLAAGRRTTKPFERDASIEQGDFFVLSGQLVYVAAVGETFRTVNADTQGRLRVVYSNGTESNILLRSLQRALYEKDRNGRRVTQADLGPLFGNSIETEDVVTGTIYVAQSLSTDPQIAALYGSLYKIGITSGQVEDRLRSASSDPTFLLAPAEIVRSWRLVNILPFQFERLIHRVFRSAQLQLSISGNFNRTYDPREWFLLPLSVIDEAIQRVMDGSLPAYVYDVRAGSLQSA